MRFFKYIILIILLFATLNFAEALDIQYGTIISVKGKNFLVSYYGIEKKKVFDCSVTSLKCSSTKKTTLGVTSANKIDGTLESELRNKDGGHITLSPSQKTVAYYIAGNDTKPTRQFVIRDIESGKEYSISNSVSYWDLINDEGKVFDFSPDSKSLVYLDDKDGASSLYITDITNLENSNILSTKISTSAYQIADFLFTDNQTIYYVGNSKDNNYAWSLYRYNLKTKKDILIESNVSYVDPIKKIGSTIVFNRLQQKGYGPELYNLSTKKISQFKIPSISTKKKSLATEEIISNGTFSGVLMKPTKINKTKSYPLVIWLHGGPYRQSSYGFHPYHSYGIYDSILELLRKNNVVVFKLNYRGSFGSGRAYAEDIKGSVGNGDVEDVMSAVTYIQNRYKINNVYLSGNSYGGYLSLKALVEHPENFKNVMSINGVTDWESLLVKMKTSIFNTQFNGLPDVNNRSLYDQASIIDRIPNIGNQLIEIIAGDADRTIPYSQATLIYDKLKEQNKNVNLVAYAGEDHVYKKKETIRDLCVRMFNFVGKSVDKECRT